MMNKIILRKKFKPCPLCEDEVMYYDGTQPSDGDIGKHFICMGCDTMFSSTIIDIVWNKRPVATNGIGDEPEKGDF